MSLTDIQPIEEIFVTLNRFEKATNAKINVEKTEALWVGNWKNNLEKPKNLKWHNDMVKTTGVYVGNKRKDVERIGFEEIKEKIKNKIKFWSGKGISLKEKIRVINSLVHSKLWYAGEVHD